MTRMTPSIETFLLLDERDQRLKVLRRFVDVLVAGNEDVRGCLSHQGLSFDSDRYCGSHMACVPSMAERSATEHRPVRSSPG